MHKPYSTAPTYQVEPCASRNYDLHTSGNGTHQAAPHDEFVATLEHFLREPLLVLLANMLAWQQRPGVEQSVKSSAEHHRCSHGCRPRKPMSCFYCLFARTMQLLVTIRRFHDFCVGASCCGQSLAHPTLSPCSNVTQYRHTVVLYLMVELIDTAGFTAETASSQS